MYIIETKLRNKVDRNLYQKDNSSIIHPVKKCLRGTNVRGGQMSKGDRCLRGTTVRGENMSRGTNVQGDKCPEGQMSRGTNVQGDNFARGTNVQGGQLFRGTLVRWTLVRGTHITPPCQIYTIIREGGQTNTNLFI